MHVKRAHHLIHPTTKGSHFARQEGGQLCSTFVQGTCPVPAQSREHPGCKSVPLPGRGRLARRRATLPPRDRVQSRSAQGPSPSRSVRGLASSDSAFRDSTYRKFQRLFRRKRSEERRVGKECRS